MSAKKRILITSALPYVAGVKHLGNLVGSMLPADIFARFCRARGYETLAICATDEHGAPVELAALEEGVPVAEYAAKWHAVQKKLGDDFALAWDNFGRSSSQANHELTLHFARALWKNDLLDLRTTKQAYSATDGRFLPDRYVIGTCPHCGYTRARGDQCENCTRVLDPVDLIDPRSAVSGATDIEIRESTHLFLKQSQFVEKLRAWIESHKQDWSPVVTSIAFKWLDEGLRDRGITRDLEWGIPVPDDIAGGALKGKVFYVWFDAPIEYIAATKEWGDRAGRDYRDWWYGEKAKDVTYWEFMGKDNVPFHTVGFPVTIMGSGEPWKLVDRLKGFNWLNYDGGKFSTSGKRGIFMDRALEVAPADIWRYYLIANAPESADSNFTWEHFAGVVNKDLADVLGNFVLRVTKFCAARFDGAMPGEGEYGEEEYAFIESFEGAVQDMALALESAEFRLAMRHLRRTWVLCNEYMTRAAPWTHIKTDRAKAAAAVRLGLNSIHQIAHVTWPVMPTLAKSIHEAIQPIGYRGGIIPWPNQPMKVLLDDLTPGQPITPPDVLVSKITDEHVEELKIRFGGSVP